MVGIAILIATVTAFVISFVFYAVAPATPPAVAAAEVSPAESGPPKWWQIVLELTRSALVAGLVAGLMLSADWHGAASGLLLGLALSILPIVLLAGSVLWEHVPVRTAGTHVVDWIIKLAAIGIIVGIST